MLARAVRDYAKTVPANEAKPTEKSESVDDKKMTSLPQKQCAEIDQRLQCLQHTVCQDPCVHYPTSNYLSTVLDAVRDLNKIVAENAGVSAAKEVTPSEESNRRWVVFVLNVGVFSDTCLVPLTKNQAIAKALDIVFRKYKENCHKYPKRVDDEDELLNDRKGSIGNLQSVNLSDEEDLIIVEICQPK
jgi:hypothetical protein